MISYGRAVILGRKELTDALRQLPARVVKTIMDDWVIRQARMVATIARRSAPRDRRSTRKKPESARLWRSIKASRVRNLKKFPGAISRAIAYSAGRNGARQSLVRQAARATKGNARRKRSPAHTVVAPRAKHFHLVVLGTKSRRQRTTGRSTGTMPTNSFFSRAAATVTASAQGEVGKQLRDAYQQGIDREIRRLTRKYT